MLGCVPENRFRQCRVPTAPTAAPSRTMTQATTPPKKNGAGWMLVALILGGALLLNVFDDKKGK